MSHMPPYEPAAEEAERVQWREWLLQQEHRLKIEQWLRERLLTEREHVLERVACAFDFVTEQLRNEIQTAVGELRTELSGQRAKADVIGSESR
jgi:hypothetical protein